MPRICILCGKPQSKSFSVFCFPSSLQQRVSWIKAIIEVKPDILKDEKVSKDYRLKNGICELHFLRSEISKGKKRRLCREAIPSVNIVASQKCNSVIKSCQTLMKNEGNLWKRNCVPKDSEITNLDIQKVKDKLNDPVLRSSSPECTIELNVDDSKDISALKVLNSLTKNNDNSDKGTCLCCGTVNYFRCLHSCLKVKLTDRDCLLIEDLCNIFQRPKEDVIKYSSSICYKCLRITEDMMELKRCYETLVALVKKKFNDTTDNFRAERREGVCLEIDENKNSASSLLGDFSLASKSESDETFIANNRKTPSCEECSQEFSNMSDLSSHHLAHYEDNKFGHTKKHKPKYSCQNCDQFFFNKISLATHTKAHQQIFDCPQCDRIITSKARLNFHLQKFHGIGKEKEKSFKCHLCVKRFTTKAGLRYHMYSLHKAGKSYNCEICGKTFSYQLLYASHKQYAHGKKNFVCEKCGEMFFTISKLNIHINAVHREAHSWLCKVCNEKFTTSSAYKHHVTVKHKRILYSCSYCESQFRKKNSLIQHLWKHNIYECFKCSVKYIEPLSFISHMSEVHGVDLSEKINIKCPNSESSVVENSVDSSSEDKLSNPDKKETESDVVINDILITSNNFDSSNIQSLSFPSENNKVNQNKSNFDDLSNVDSIHFDNVDALEMQTAPNETMELEEDVTLINVQMLEGIPVPEHSNLKPIKDEILSPDKQNDIRLEVPLQTDISNDSTTTLRPSSTSIQPPVRNEQSKSNNKLNELTIINNLTSSSLPSSSKTTDEHSLTIVEPLVTNHLESSGLVNLPVILQPVKNNDWSSFPNSLDDHSETSVDPVIHSLNVENSMQNDPPITREIDITIPSEDEESKITPLSNAINDVNKIDNQDISTLPVDIDGKYVMYFDSSLEKN